MLPKLTRKSAQPKPPERSRLLRGLILAAMLVPLVAIGRVAPALWPHVAVTALAMVAGHWYSYRNLDRNRQLVRAAMFVAIHLALAWLFVGLFGGLAVPQAQFAIFAQGITTFDLRYRRSLLNTLLHSLAVLYVAASLSRTFELALYLLLFGTLALAAFFVAERADGLTRARIRPRPDQAAAPRSLTLFGLGFGGLVVVAVIVTFLFIPRFANNPIIPPFTLNVPLRGGVQAEIINPGVPLVQINGWNDGTGDYFYGFDSNLDLRYRGGLSDKVVMYVRSPSRGYWRSHSYDYYTGVSWEQSDKAVTEIDPGGIYYRLSPPPGSPVLDEEAATPAVEPQRIVQSFTIAREQPNLLFATYRPAEVLILAERLMLDSGGGIRLPETLKPGLTYSVVSYRPEFNPAQLRRESSLYPPEITGRYLQLPPNISERTRQLARRLTESYPNNYDRVLALNQHLLSEYPYNFFPPPHPPGAEVVDTFLFVDREGVCEQYVTALVVMARSLGIPARLATGYGAGDFNPITNYYEVRLNDAHSWAEIYFPESGWVPFDPTPGWTPQPFPTPAQNWLFANRGLLELGIDLPTAPLAAIASGGWRGLLFFLPFLAGSALLVGLGLLLLQLSKRLNLSFGTRATSRYPPSTDPGRRLILELYRQGIRLLVHRRKVPARRPGETLAEYARRAGQLPGLASLTRAAEIAAYRPGSPDEETVTAAQKGLAALKRELSRRRSKLLR